MGRRRGGITLVEVLVVIAIVAVLVAITQPILIQAKRYSQQANCISNLRHYNTAIVLYQNEYDGTPEGTPTQMGLPPFDAMSKLAEDLKCPRPSALDCAGPGLYLLGWIAAPFSTPASDQAWSELVARRGPGTILVVDRNHSATCPSTHFSLNKGMGVTLGGSVIVKVKRQSATNFDKFFYDD